MFKILGQTSKAVIFRNDAGFGVAIKTGNGVISVPEDTDSSGRWYGKFNPNGLQYVAKSRGKSTAYKLYKKYR